MRRSLIILLAAIGLAAIGATPALAQKVGNPGSFSAKLVNGEMKVKTNEFGFDESQNVNFAGTVDKAGNVNIPSIVFPDQQIDNVPIAGSVTVKINVVNPTTGTINPNTGAFSLRLKVWIKIDGVPLGGGCRVGSASSPIDINTLITGTTSPPGPNTPMSGTPYSPATGLAKVVNNSFAVPSSSDCGPAASTVNDMVSSPAGNNSAAFDLRFTPILTKGVNPVLNASPASGTAPFQTTLSAAGTTAPAGVANYQWDFDGNGTTDQTTTTATTTHSYTSGGTFNARVRVTDSEGDSSDAVRAVTVNAYPDLSISSSHGAFRIGGQGTYRLTVKNDGYAATTGPTTVRATLPSGLTYAGVAGSGWTCVPDGADALCTRTATIARGATAPDLELTVNVGPAALGQVTPSFRVTTTGDNGPGNDVVTDPTTVTGIDLRIEKSHEAHGMRPGQDPANRYSIEVENAGNAATAGPVTVTDELPEGLSFVSADGGPSWTCGESGGVVTCTRAATLAPGELAPAIELRVAASLEAGSTGTEVINQAQVSTADDVDASNDVASDPTLILDGPDLTIVKSHQGNFVAGSQENYSLAVRNAGPLPTTGTTTITDELPAGLTYVTAAGDGWECAEDEGEVVCEHAAPIAAESAAEPVQLTVAVGEAAIPEVTNTASVATPDDGNPANDSSSDPTLVRAIDLLVEKSHQGVFRSDRNGTYRLAVRNAGDSVTAGPTVLTDVLPSSLEFVSADGGAAWECGEEDGTVTCTHEGEIEAGDSAPAIDLTVKVLPAAMPSVTNTASVETVDDFNPANDSSSDEAVVVDLDAAIAIQRTGSFEIGERGTYLVSVDNEGSAPTTGALTAEIELAEGLEPVSAAGNGWSCATDDRTITCDRATILAAETPAADIAVRVGVNGDSVSPLTTSATVATTGDRNPANDEAEDVAEIATPDLTVASAHEGALRVGRESAYEITVRNVGEGATTAAVNVNDELPEGVELTGATGRNWVCEDNAGDVTCELLRRVAAGAAAPALSLRVKPAPAALPAGETHGSVENRVSVSTLGDSVASNDGASENTDLTALDLGIGITGDETIAAGGEGSFEMLVENAGSAGADRPVRVEGSLPAGLTASGITGNGWNCGVQGAGFECLSSQAVAPGEGAEPIELGVDAARAATGDLDIEVAVHAADDVNSANDHAVVTTTIGGGPDLATTLTAHPADGFRAGKTGVLRATLINEGTSATAQESVLTIDAADGLTYGSASGAGWSCTGEGAITCVHVQPLAAGEIAKVDLTFEAARPAGANETSTATAFTVGDTDTSNDGATVATPISWIDLAISRAHRGEWVAGGTGAYSVTVKNVGGASTTGPIRVSETLPAGTTFASATGQGWDCVASGRTLECLMGGSLPAGGSAAFEVTLDLAVAAVPSVEAASTVSTEDDLVASNDRATETIAVAPVASKPDVLLPVTIGGGTFKALKDGSIYLRLSCPATATQKCRGKVSLVTAKKVATAKKKPKAKRILALGSSSYAIAVGRTAPVRVVVPKKARAVLKRLKKTPVRATASSQGLADASTRITVKAP